MNTVKTPAYIAVDWGSSNFRGYLCNHQGQALDTCFSPHGVLKLKRPCFDSLIQQELKTWLVRHPELPVIMCGMVGSANGWVETQYLDCPVDLTSLAQKLIQAPSAMQRSLWIVPGVRQLAVAGKHAADVMRGEETQILGASLLQKAAAMQEQHELSQIVCLPGTHCKWAHISGKTMHGFTTYMSGELFSLLLQTKSLARQLEGVAYKKIFQKDVFIQGIEAVEQGAGFFADIFNIRVQLLNKKLQPQQIREYLSGVMVAHEMMQAQTYLQLKLPVTLVASGVLAERYQCAFTRLGVTVTTIKTETVTLSGLHDIAKNAGIYSTN